MSETPLEKALEAIIDIFHQYSVRLLPHDQLSKAQLATMMKEQLPNFLQKQKNPDAIDRLFKDLDKNKDNRVSFEEMMVFFSKVLINLHIESHHDH